MLSRWLAVYSHWVPDMIKQRAKFLYRYLKTTEVTLSRLLYNDRIIETDYGIQLRIDPTDLAQSRFVDEKKMGETAMIEFFLKEIKNIEGDFFDVGANVGIYSILFRDRVEGENRVIAFEPLEQNITRIKSNAKLNNIKNINIHPVALGNQNGEEKIYYDPSNVGAASLATQPGVITKTINIHRLDSLDLLSKNVGIMKIDVEGAELDVLKGAESMLIDMKPGLLIETHPEILDERNQSIEKLLSVVNRLGYQEVELVQSNKRFEIGTLVRDISLLKHEHAIYCRP